MPKLAGRGHSCPLGPEKRKMKSWPGRQAEEPTDRTSEFSISMKKPEILYERVERIHAKERKKKDIT